MSNKLKEKSNNIKDATSDDKSKDMSERDELIIYLKNILTNTLDCNLKYDINKCIETLMGKENQEYTDIKNALFENLTQTETLYKEKCDLQCELEELKQKLQK